MVLFPGEKSGLYTVRRSSDCDANFPDAGFVALCGWCSRTVAEFCGSAGAGVAQYCVWPHAARFPFLAPRACPSSNANSSIFHPHFNPHPPNTRAYTFSHNNAAFFPSTQPPAVRTHIEQHQCHQPARRMTSGGPPAIDFQPPGSDDVAFWANFAAEFRHKFGDMVRSALFPVCDCD